jgi:hypothetical protein
MGRTCLWVLALLLSGCATTQVPSRPTSENTLLQAVLYFSGPDHSRVRVFAISNGSTNMVSTDFGEFQEPAYLRPGNVSLTFACPGVAASYDNRVSLDLPGPGLYYLYCSRANQLAIGTLKAPPN